MISNSTPGYIPKRIAGRRSNKNLYTDVHSSTILNEQRWGEPKCPSVDERTSNMSFHTGICSGIERNEVPTPVVTRRNPENVTISERSRHKGVHPI